MELEFDKEIDALLRKAKRGSTAVAGAPVATPHLDADQLAAFAENAVPDRTRAAYVAHMADCDTCRTMLSSFVTTAPEKAAAAAAFAAQPARVAAVRVPWWRRFLSGPNLAYTMGGLVVLFSGFIGLLVYQNQQAIQSSRSAQIAKSEPTPVTESEAPQAFSNASTANTAANSNAASPVENVTKTGVAVGSANSSTATTESDEAQPQSNSSAVAGKPAAEQPLVASAPPPEKQPVAAPKDEPAPTGDRDAKAEKERAADKMDDTALSADSAKRKVGEDQRARREDLSNAKTATMKPSGPRQVQNAQNNAIIQNQTIDGVAAGTTIATEKKTDLRRGVGGKTFEMRGGVWYDSAYSGGGTKDVKRGTDKYIRLDQGLRNIADSLGGTVVIVWDGKAYKIR